MSFAVGNLDLPSITWFLGPTWVSHLNGTSISTLTDTQTVLRAKSAATGASTHCVKARRPKIDQVGDEKKTKYITVQLYSSRDLYVKHWSILPGQQELCTSFPRRFYEPASNEPVNCRQIDVNSDLVHNSKTRTVFVGPLVTAGLSDVRRGYFEWSSLIVYLSNIYPHTRQLLMIKATCLCKKKNECPRWGSTAADVHGWK